MKAKVKLGLARLTVTEKIVGSKHIVANISANPAFASPNPPLAQISAAISELETAFNKSENSGKAGTIILHQKEEILDALLTILGNYVENIANGSEEIILAAGMKLKTISNSSAAPPGFPEKFSADIGSKDGEIDLKWKLAKGAKAYLIQQSLTSSGEWEQIAIVTKRKHTASGFESGKKYWFRVAALGSAGQSDWSNPAQGMAR